MSKQHDYLRAIEKISDTKRREQLDAEEETTMFEPRYYKHNTTGAIEKVITQERAFALEKNTDWKRFYYTFQKEPKEETVAEPFKDKLKEEIERLDEDSLEIAEEVDRLSENLKEMGDKRQEFWLMLNAYEEFTEKYPDTLL